MNKDINDVIENGVKGRDDCLAIWRRQSPETWSAVEERYLHHAIDQALGAPFFRGRSLPAAYDRSQTAYARLRHMPILRKTDYWENLEQLKLPAYDRLTHFRFHTSGTELGFATEQPWDEWTFVRSFCESSAIALSRSGAAAGDGVIIGSPAFGALARAYLWAAGLLGLDAQADDHAFSDDAAFSATLAFARRPHVRILVGTPGAIQLFCRKCEERGCNPAQLGIERVISGVGNFLTRRHIDLIIEKLDPAIIIEQGGKNEILHAPGAVRYDKHHPDGVCPQGYLHYLPYVSSILAVDVAALKGAPIVQTADDGAALLLMSRLTVGREGVVAYVNDAGDFGSVKRYGHGKDAVCPCGSTLPSFRFSGRVGGSISNKLGDTLFNEEFGLALDRACRSLNIPGELAVQLRYQIILVRPQAMERPDVLCWAIGAPRSALAGQGDRLAGLAQAFIRCWTSYETYTAGSLASYMVIGQGALVNIEAMPHAGRDKPQYRLAVIVEAPDGGDTRQVLSAHLRETLGADELFLSAIDGDE
jgi:hypothetical protein